MKKIIVSVLFLTAFTAAFSQEEARVMKVKDGDTYVLRTTAKEHTIRLLNVDAPELNQHWGFNSWLNVKALILGKVVKFEVLKTDVYGRELAMVYVDGQRLDEILIANGWAWHYINFDTDARLEDLMRKASSERKGLWECGAEKVCPPWLFRKYNARNRYRFCKGCIATKK